MYYPETSETSLQYVN